MTVEIALLGACCVTVPPCYWATGQEMRLVCRGGWLQILRLPRLLPLVNPECHSLALRDSLVRFLS
jgi:hypothetical protein